MQQVFNDIVSKISSDLHELFQTVIDETPVDTGAAKAHHSLDDIPFVASNVSTPDLSIVKVRQRLESDSLQLVNNTPYIGKLENGGSQQSPIGFYAVNLLRFERRNR